MPKALHATRPSELASKAEYLISAFRWSQFAMQQAYGAQGPLRHASLQASGRYQLLGHVSMGATVSTLVSVAWTRARVSNLAMAHVS